MIDELVNGPVHVVTADAVTAGRGLMTIGDETREIAQGDLVHIPPDAVHSLRPVSEHAPIHCFAFAVAVAGAGAIDYTSH